MQPISFKEQNTVLRPPQREANVQPLPVLAGTYEDTGVQFMISCWQLSWREYFKLLFSRKIYLCALGSQPPILMATKLKDLGVEEDDT